MAMRLTAFAIVAMLGVYVWSTNQKVANPATPTKVDSSPKFFDPDVQGVVPDTDPDLHVDVNVEREGEKAKIFFTISESHGWYVDHIYIDFWYVENNESGEPKQIGKKLKYMCHNYLPFGETITEYTTPQSHEFPEIDDFGTTENWRAAAAQWNKVLAPAAK